MDGNFLICSQTQVTSRADELSVRRLWSSVLTLDHLVANLYLELTLFNSSVGINMH